MAHPNYTSHFREELNEAVSLRAPLTASATLYAEATELGSRVIWLHTYGERYANPKAGHPYGPPQVSDPTRRPTLAKPVPTSPDRHPSKLRYHSDTSTIELLDDKGKTSGTATNVAPRSQPTT